MVSELINASPVVYEKKERRVRNSVPAADVNEYAAETIDQLEIYDHIRDIKDPEHPYSLEELKVITEDAIEVDDSNRYVRVTFTPTVEHCSMATIIGLCLRVKLMRSLPSQFKDGYFLEVTIRFIDALGHASVVNPTLECVISTIQKKDGQIKYLQIDIRIAPGSHATEDAVNKQLNDKERVAAALENPNLVEMVDECLAPSFSC